MCGICGIASSDPKRPIQAGDLLAMRDVLTHRGPDDSGQFLAPGIALGSRRLSIIDLSERGRMPMTTEDGRYSIAYNGEVYNFKELRSQLEAGGHNFYSDTDTEVVLKLFADEGPEMLQRLNGMFAIAIWDSQDRSLFLARDRMGVKPLYYTVQNGRLLFASEEKSLFAAGVTPEFDTATWQELLCFRYVAGERTPYSGVKRLLPGHFLMWKNGQLRISRWWNLAERATELRTTLPADPFEWFKDTLDDAVGLRRISDVPIGVLLSGGLDSSSVAASLASQAGSGLASFTVRFEEARYDEGPLARQVADRWKLDYHELKVAPEKLLKLLHDASWLNDEPLVHGNDLYILSISNYAKSRVTVLLSGEGADETLGGYVRYQPLRYPRLLAGARPVLPGLVSTLNLNGRLRKLSRFLELGSLEQFVLFNACDVLPEDLKRIGMKTSPAFAFREAVLAEGAALYPGDLMRQAMYSDHHTFLCSILDRNDRMTMGASIECRVPFLDYRLVEMLAAMPSSVLLGGRKNKHILRRAVGERLPRAIREHRKWGFAVPWGRYFRQTAELKELVQNLPDMDPINEGPFDLSKLRTIVDEFLSGDTRHDALISQFVMVAIWHQACFQSHKRIAKVAL
jgi:asparagine synthase (glutamine-hydrolysing)